MKSFALPSIFLGGFGLIAAALGLFSFQNAAEARLLQSSAEKALADEITARDLAKANRDRLEVDTRPADNFIAHWKDAFLTADQNQSILATLDSLAVKNLATSSGKDTKTDVGYMFRSKAITVLSISTTISGDYYRLLNWLGDAERQYPLARIESVTFTNDQGLKLTAKMSFPTNFKMPVELPKPTTPTINIK